MAKRNKYSEANAIYEESLKGIEHHLLPLWRDWMVMCLRAHQETGQMSWAKSAISILPYALRCKPHKTKLQISSFFTLLSKIENDEETLCIAKEVLENCHMKPFLFWLPQLIRLFELQSKLSEIVVPILNKMAVYYPQILYFTIKPFYKYAADHALEKTNSSSPFVSMKKAYSNLISKLDRFSHLLIEICKEKRVGIEKIGAISRCLGEMCIPMFESYPG